MLGLIYNVKQPKAVIHFAGKQLVPSQSLRQTHREWQMSEPEETQELLEEGHPFTSRALRPRCPVVSVALFPSRRVCAWLSSDTRDGRHSGREAVVTDPAPDHKPAAPGEQRPVAMTPYAIAAACCGPWPVTQTRAAPG